MIDLENGGIREEMTKEEIENKKQEVDGITHMGVPSAYVIRRNYT